MTIPASAIDPQVRRQAIYWYVLLSSGEATEAERSDCEHWRSAHPQHADAWARLDAVRGNLLSSVAGAPSSIAIPTLTALGAKRRSVVKGMMWLALGAGGSALMWREQPWQTYLADFKTGRGEQREFKLADGSLVILNTATQVNQHYDSNVRRLQLLHGEIIIQTGKLETEARSFEVLTRHGRIKALGTRFIVRDMESHTQVTVLEHAVEITPQDSTATLQLNAGQQIRFDKQATNSPETMAPNAEAWAQGSLVVNDWSLSKVIAELARYRTGVLRCSPAASAIRVSGVFPLKDTDRALAILVGRFPIRLASMSRYWVSVEPTE
ncbi:MAG: FecR domain-containing protein [Cellvibrio sp.]|uniref:FecR domain-containing protein n=1 Tax=Cellvibrio sp. TaxID=1965322 RepID=UPI0031AA170B